MSPDLTSGDKKCNVCGKSDFPIVVCYSGLGAMSIAYCPFCHGMGAEPKDILEPWLDITMSGIENVHPDHPLTFYEPAFDAYVDKKTEKVIPIPMMNGVTVHTREEAIAEHWKIYHEINKGKSSEGGTQWCSTRRETR